MNWFLKEIWKDLQHVPGGYEDPRVVATDELKEQQHMTNVLGELRKHHLIKSASYCPRQKRIRVTALGVQQPLYKSRGKRTRSWRTTTWMAWRRSWSRRRMR